MSDSLWPHGLQHTRPPCPSPTHRVYPNSRPLSWWCHPTISSSSQIYQNLLKFMSIEVVMLFNHLVLCHLLLLLYSLGFFPMNQLFASGCQSIGASALASVLPRNIQDWFPLGWTGCISLQSKGLSGIFSNITVQKHQFLSAQPFLWSNSHIHMRLLEKPKLWLYRALSAKWHLCFLIFSLGLP